MPILSWKCVLYKKLKNVSLTFSLDDTYNYRNDKRQYCHTVEGLSSCEKYTFNIYTTHNGARSKDFQTFRAETLPAMPSGIKMLNYDSDSVEISWDNNIDAVGYSLNVKPGMC